MVPGWVALFFLLCAIAFVAVLALVIASVLRSMSLDTVGGVLLASEMTQQPAATA